MSKIEFSKDEKNILAAQLRQYLDDELDVTIGQFDASFLLDFVSEQLGAYYYNRGLLDAQAILETRVDSIIEAIYEIEKPTAFTISDQPTDTGQTKKV